MDHLEEEDAEPRMPNNCITRSMKHQGKHERKDSDQYWKDNKYPMERFQISEEYRASHAEHIWTEKLGSHIDKIASEDRSYCATRKERARFQHIWKLTLNSSGPNGPVNQREDYTAPSE